MEINSKKFTTQQPYFDVDGTLGRLAKWLRILGFDAAYPRSVPSPGRYFVTPRELSGDPRVVTVTAKDPMQQLKQVLSELELRADPDRFFTRCVICNVPVIEIPRTQVVGRVPKMIIRMKSEFHECPKCGRIYWEGSHLGRIKRRLESSSID
ncbi:MAG TPA: Mut7-C RNAse domain-containing protein [Desulfomonilaceae bacterium]|nr:Mut7-C RNAse domain-containing protein [Desulfomonilaceae bacterium]